jgi:imidazolonepropionase
MRCDSLWQRARLITFAGDAGLGIVEDGLVASHAGRIVYAGPRAQAPALEADERIDCAGRWITPGLIDCHTHLVYAGDRADEFEARLNGANYEDIARAGGGIRATVRTTRAASEAELSAVSLERLDALIAEGVTTVEIKSGYGLTLADECKLLRAAQALSRARAVNVATTFLGAHAVPEGRSAQEYIDEVCTQMIPAVAAEKLADAVDVFCERIAFTAEQAAQVFAAAQRHGLRVKIHAEQLSNQHGAALAARHGALSADHLEYLDDAGVLAMAQAGTVAVLLPGAFYFTRETRLPPIAALRALGVRIALATDCNPGTSPLTSPLLAMNLGATLFRLTVEECLAGFTREAARAIGRLDEIGTLESGKWCDLAIWNIARPAELVYRMGARPLHARIHRGHIA